MKTPVRLLTQLVKRLRREHRVALLGCALLAIGSLALADATFSGAPALSDILFGTGAAVGGVILLVVWWVLSGDGHHKA